MLKPRIIPCLLIQNGGLVKTVQFGSPKYVGDPINAVKIFNEKEVDELIVIDIDATVKKSEPDFKLIKSLASECRMPLCYGGGIKTFEHIDKIISLGVEKVALSSSFINSPDLISFAAQRVGSQSIVVVLDIKKSGFTREYTVFTHNGRKKITHSLLHLAQMSEEVGAGEIVLNSIDRDGVMKGYDHNLVKKIKEKVTIPVTVLGGAGDMLDIRNLIQQFGIIGAAAGSMFVFKGKYRAVLINYPSRDEKDNLQTSVIEMKERL